MNKTEQRLARGKINYWLDEATPEEWEEGLVWYDEAKEWAEYLSERFNVSRTIAAAVISILSPNNRWERNKIDASSLFMFKEKGRDIAELRVCTYNKNKEKAWAVADGNNRLMKKSPKTYAFARNVGGTGIAHVTIDKWMLRATQTKSKSPKTCRTTITPKNYKILEKNIVKVANKRELKPYQAQAIVWVTIRNRWNN